MSTETFITALIVLVVVHATGLAQVKESPSNRLSVNGDHIIYETDFSKGIDDWEFSDREGWKVEQLDGVTVLNQFRKEASFKPPVRSPLHRALLKTVSVASFQLDVEVRSTHTPYDHRDVCLFFGYKDPKHFYYVHLGQKADPHCNQVFIVNEADRRMISETTSEGTSWDDAWHHIRIIRNVETGEILVYFDDMDSPAMTANDKTFLDGRIGIGSFDDTSAWRKLSLKEIETTAE